MVEDNWGEEDVEYQLVAKKPKKPYKRAVLLLALTIGLTAIVSGGLVMTSCSATRNQTILLNPPGSTIELEAKAFSLFKDAALSSLDEMATQSGNNIEEVKFFQGFLSQDRKQGVARVILVVTRKDGATIQMAAEVGLRQDEHNIWQTKSFNVVKSVMLKGPSDGGSTDAEE